MTSLISPLNPISNLLGFRTFLEWEYCVFERSLIKEHSEGEYSYELRIAYLIEGIKAQIEYLDDDESSKSYTATEKMTFLKRLDERKKEIIDLLGFDPTALGDELDGTEGDEVPLSEFVREKLDGSVKTKTKREYSESKLTQVLGLMLLENIDLTIHDAWTFFHNNQGCEVYDLIEVKSVSDKTGDTAELIWCDARTGDNTPPIKRKSLATAISKKRTEMKKI